VTVVEPRDLVGPDPAGFGHCRACAYCLTGPVRRCYTCARELGPKVRRCEICDQVLVGNAACPNAMCHSAHRVFEYAMVISPSSPAVTDALWRLDGGRRPWGHIFGRVVLGFLYDNRALTSSVSAIIPAPAALDAHAAPNSYRNHAHWVLEQAAAQDDRGLPFVLDTPLLVKDWPTPRVPDTADPAERRSIAGQHYDSLRVPDPSLVEDRYILLYDDLFTGGEMLNAAAKTLIEAGARGVYGLALTRQARTFAPR
jgi:predicted amidophosphoribosyltransferase